MMAVASVEPVARAMLSWMGDGVVFGTLFACATFLVLRVTPLRRAPAAVHATLWLVVLLRFVVVSGPAVPWSMATALARLQGPAAESPDLPDEAGQVAVEPILVTAASATEGVAWIAESGGMPWWSVAAAAYGSCVVALAALRIRGYLVLARRCREMPCGDAAAAAVVAAACRRLGVRRRPDVRISDVAPAPYVLGLLRPTLVLSRWQFGRSEELEAVVLHEVAHLRRWDLLVRHVQWLVGTLLFFWPVVAWVNRRIDLAREQACDEWAIRCGRLSAGEYARCLLRAIHPVQPQRWSFQPAAMAAHVATVERRIEMVLELSKRPSAHGMGRTGGLALLAWAGFVLGGVAQAAVEPPAQKEPAQTPQTAEKVVVEAGEEGEGGQIVIRVESTGGEGASECEDVLLRLDDLTGDMAGQPAPMFVARGDGVDGGRMMMFMHTDAFGPKHLEAFRMEHETADANGDGQLTRAERDAFLIARAMSDPQAVLDQFPQADRDQNGSLAAEEAALLVHGLPIFERMHQGIAAEPLMVARRAVPPPGVPHAPEEGRQERVMIKRDMVFEWSSSDPPPPPPPGAGMKWIEQHLSNRPDRWIAKNIPFDPEVEVVARYVPAAEQAPLAAFLILNPEADANGDGKLTPDERDAFVKRTTSRTRAKFLEKFPQADTDGDGVLSEEEFRAFRPPGVRMVRARASATAGGQHEVTIEESDDGVKQVRVQRSVVNWQDDADADAK